MKILAIDDQQLILMSLEKKLKEQGYEIKTAQNAYTGMKFFDEFQPDLVILDINMPYVSGLEVVKYIRREKKSSVPVLIMSGKTNEWTIKESFELGIDDFMKKPVSLNEVLARINRILGKSPNSNENTGQFHDQYLHKSCVGVIIPCYNEAERISVRDFKEFVENNYGYHLCFVNDGSKDDTLEVLKRVREGNEQSISIVDCVQNGGKAEAVGQGAIHLLQDGQFDYIGYLDADLSTDLNDFKSLVNTLENSEFKIVSGSRISRMGADITKQSARQIISKTINLIIQKILGMKFKDTQCGAKIMDRDMAALVLTKKFVTRWLFDVEIFVRIRKSYGSERAGQIICEQPLRRWIHADGSKLSMKDSFKIVGQLAKIAMYYKAS